MNEVDLKEMEAPTLVFGEVENMVKEEAPLAEIPKTETVKQELDDSILTDEERRQVDEFSKPIDLH
ncbi:MAG: hypothetical protein K2M22_05810, partial [Lachnospiraceae bacterium]|nr:hypothetical protein [Lachnospiraceae bacterium]